MNKAKKIEPRATAGAVRWSSRPPRVLTASAGASFHGGGLVTDKPDSPHSLAPKIKARMYFGVAQNDDQRQPDAKDKLKETAAARFQPRSKSTRPSTDGACPTCRLGTARFTASPTLSAPKAGRAVARRSPDFMRRAPAGPGQRRLSFFSRSAAAAGLDPPGVGPWAVAWRDALVQGQHPYTHAQQRRRLDAG